MATKTRKQTSTNVDEILSMPYKIVLGNDDYNTFDWVITCLIKICGHEVEQATQCAHVVHYKGECVVKYGFFEELSPMKEKLQHAGLCAILEQN